jgi:diaminopimelate decarboxylase
MSYVAVDGGMGDNIRPALYQAEVFSRCWLIQPLRQKLKRVNLVGKYCESGDILIKVLSFAKNRTWRRSGHA